MYTFAKRSHMLIVTRIVFRKIILKKPISYLIATPFYVPSALSAKYLQYLASSLSSHIAGRGYVQAALYSQEKAKTELLPKMKKKALLRFI